MPDHRAADDAPRLNPGPFAPLAGFHTGQTGEDPLDTLIGKFACASAGFIVVLIAAQFLRAGVL